MIPAKDSITVYCGSLTTRRYRWERAGLPVNLAGASIRVRFRSTIDSQQVLLELSTLNNSIVIEGDGWFRLNFLAAPTSLIDTGKQFRAIGHLVVTLANQEPIRFAELNVLFMPSTDR